MTAFFFGVVFGMIFAGSVAAVIYVTIKRPKQDDIEPWAEEAYQDRAALPRVTTKVSIHKRTISL